MWEKPYVIYAKNWLTVIPITYLGTTRHAKNVKTQNDFFLNNQPDILIIQILFYYKTLHV